MAALAYALEPNDQWYYDQLDREDAKKAASDAFIERFVSEVARPWNFANRLKESEAASFFSEAIESLGDHKEQTAAFNQALLGVWVSPATFERSQRLANLIDKAVEQIAQREFEKNPALFDF